MVYSASIAYAEADPDTHNRHFYLIRHGVYLTISLIVGWVVYHIPSRVWQEKAPYLFVGAFVLLILVLVPGIGKVVNGSRRWINLVVLNLQPSELMKLAVVMYAANYTVRKAAFMHDFKKGFLPMLSVMVFIGALLLRGLLLLDSLPPPAPSGARGGAPRRPGAREPRASGWRQPSAAGTGAAGSCAGMSARVSAAKLRATASMAPPPTVPSRCQVGESAAVRVAMVASTPGRRGGLPAGAGRAAEASATARSRRRQSSWKRRAARGGAAMCRRMRRPS